MYNLLCVAPNSFPSLGRKARDSMLLVLKLATLVMAPLVILNVTRTAEFDMPYNTPFVGQYAMSLIFAEPIEAILTKLPFNKLMVPK